MDNGILFTVKSLFEIALFAGMLIFIVAMYNKMIKPAEKRKYVAKKRARSLKENAVYDVEINRLVYEIKLNVAACKIIVGRFHNGGFFNNALPMQKFTVTHETPLGSAVPLQACGQGVLNSRYPEAMLCLATLEIYDVYDVVDCKDPNYKHDMEKFGFKSSFMFLINQFDGEEEGFIGINYQHTHVMTPEQKDKVRDAIPRLLGLINMKEEHLIN